MLLICFSPLLAEDPAAPSAPKINTGDTAWMLVSTALVMLMIPGLALFYGGMVRRKNILSTMMQSMVAIGLVGLQWVLIGYSMVFGTTRSGVIGWNWDYVGLSNVKPGDLFPGTSIPVYVHCMYQGMFAIITPALISGAFAERIRFGPYCLFILLWSILVYNPIAHWVWGVTPTSSGVDPAGWLGAMGALDFAGGTVVHISAGFSALAAILLLKKRQGYPEHSIHPSSMVLTLFGAGLLWFGWFGFNGGSALAANSQAGLALTTTQVAAAAAALSWLVVEWIHRGKPTALGFASGLVAGLVAVTPASGFVTPLGAMCIGLAAGAICYGAVLLKGSLGYDDSLDAFGVHGVGGLLGALLTGVFVSAATVRSALDTPDAKVGVLGPLGNDYPSQMGVQALASLASIVFAMICTTIIVKLIDSLWGFTVGSQEENEGLDRAEHGEIGFDMGLGIEMAPAPVQREPRPAVLPPTSPKGNYTVVVEGAQPKELMTAWSKLCGGNGTAPSQEFKDIYANMTTVKGNRFQFRGGDPGLMRDAITRLFSDQLDGNVIQTHIEK